MTATATVTCDPNSITASARSAALADRLEAGARRLADLARSLSAAEWRLIMPHDGRTVGVIVHHVASVYPLEVHLAQMMAAGTPIVGVTAATIDEMNAGHAHEHAGVTPDEALALLAANSAAAARDIRALTDEDLDRAVPVSLYGDAELTCQFMLEDHAVRHSLHHCARLASLIRQRRDA